MWHCIVSSFVLACAFALSGVNANAMDKMLNFMTLLRLFMNDNSKLLFILYFCNQNILQRYEFIPECQ